MMPQRVSTNESGNSASFASSAALKSFTLFLPFARSMMNSDSVFSEMPRLFSSSASQH